MSDRVAPCPDLLTMVEVYPEDKRVKALVPLDSFLGTDKLQKGVEVKVGGRSGQATAVVKRFMVEVEVDLATFDGGVAEGQESLGV